MRDRDYVRGAQRRIARAEAECHATILRAFDKVLRVLNREVTERRIRLDRSARMKGKRSASPQTKDETR